MVMVRVSVGMEHFPRTASPSITSVAYDSLAEWELTPNFAGDEAA